MPNLEELENAYRGLEARYREHKRKGEKLFVELDIAYAKYKMAKTGIAGGSVVEVCTKSGKTFRGVFRGWYYSEKFSGVVRVGSLQEERRTQPDRSIGGRLGHEARAGSGGVDVMKGVCQ